jgi:hypothetical protein
MVFRAKRARGKIVPEGPMIAYSSKLKAQSNSEKLSGKRRNTCRLPPVQPFSVAKERFCFHSLRQALCARRLSVTEEQEIK